MIVPWKLPPVPPLLPMVKTAAVLPPLVTRPPVPVKLPTPSENAFKSR